MRDIWDLERFQQRYQRCYQTQRQSRDAQQTPSVQQPSLPFIAQHHQQYYYALRYPPLILRTEHQRQPTLQPPAALSAEVPEFFPKSSCPLITYPNSDNRERGSKPICQPRYFPSVHDRNYQRELFPYNRPQQENATAFLVNESISKTDSEIIELKCSH